MSADQHTANAFATSWNNLPLGSVYTHEQFMDWLDPITQKDIEHKTVLEMGCGNGSLLMHMAQWNPSQLTGVDLGDSIFSAKKNLTQSEFKNWTVVQKDMNSFHSEGFDVVYCIGVLHHLKNPQDGLSSVIRNVKPGGKFHCWVYAEEGNSIVIKFVDPLRKLCSRWPWWLTKFFIATPLAVPFYLYAHFLKYFVSEKNKKSFPLYDYCIWISQREFSFFRHVVFDQLVTPQTIYINKKQIEEWLSRFQVVDEKTIYITMRNGNSWKFGARVKK